MYRQHKNLIRLPDEYYRGQAYVHWTLTIEDRRTGWLTPIFYYHFRELLTHTMFRYAVTCPIYCCMPDHIHLLWIGILDHTDQRVAIKYLRKQTNGALRKIGFELQRQPYDHVLTEQEREREAFAGVAEYIARNPERAKLVPVDGYANYKCTGSLIPGCPELKLWTPDYWDRFWRNYSYLRQHGLTRGAEPAV